jgi:mitogen-activated protein kinase kinase kinase
MLCTLGEFLGEGSFGKVYKGLNESTGELIAVKQLFLANGSSEEVAQLRKEISVMWDLNHANIVRYLGTARSDRWLFILLEYVPGGSIANMLHQFGAFTESLLKRFTAQIVCGTTYLHSKGIIHRDIKGANVLVGVDGIAKLSDFGCSKKVYGVCTTSIEESMKVMQGSVPWMAPEVVKQTGSGFASDIWSIGATIIEMATGKPPWTELFTSNLAAMFHVATLVEPPPFPANLSDDCAAFLRKCLVIDPKYRTPAADLTLDHYIALQS